MVEVGWLVRMEWRPARWSVFLLIFPCTKESRRRFLLAPAPPGSPGERAVKRLWWWCLGLFSEVQSILNEVKYISCVVF